MLDDPLDQVMVLVFGIPEGDLQIGVILVLQGLDELIGAFVQGFFELCPSCLFQGFVVYPVFGAVHQLVELTVEPEQAFSSPSDDVGDMFGDTVQSGHRPGEGANHGVSDLDEIYEGPRVD